MDPTSMATAQAPIDIVVLAGGAATRLGALAAQTPKSLLQVSGLPFVLWPLFRIHRTTKLGRIIVSARAGQAAMFRAALSDHIKKLQKDLVIIEENSPIGTGGAILSMVGQAAPGDPFLVLNGDVCFALDAGALARAARERGAAMAAVAVPDSRAFGTLEIDGGRVAAYREKQPATMPRPGVINAGLYAFTHAVLKDFPPGPCSFEHDIAPVLVARGQLGAVVAPGPFLDIGTPESYAAAPAMLEAMAVPAGMSPGPAPK